MATSCQSCGQEIADGVTFCTSCGAKVEKAEPAAPPVQQPVYQQSVQPVYQQNFAPAANQSKTVSIGAYFGLMLLFSIPVIGFIACIITAFAPENKSLKNFARAILIWTIIAVILVGILCAFGILFADVLTESVGDITGLPIDEISDSYNDLDAYDDFDDAYSDFDDAHSDFGESNESFALPDNLVW